MFSAPPERSMRRHAGGLRSHPLARLKQALREGRVNGATRELGEKYGFDGRDIERVTHERQERDRHVERMDAGAQAMERERAAAKANGTPVAAQKRVRAAVPQRSVLGSGEHFTDSSGVRRFVGGAQLPDHAQLSAAERMQLRMARSRKRKAAAGNVR